MNMSIGHNLAIHGDEIYLKALITRKGKESYTHGCSSEKKKKKEDPPGSCSNFALSLLLATSRIASSMLEITLLETTLTCLSE